MTEKNEPTGPCPPLEDVSEDEQADIVLAEEKAADFDAEETNTEEGQSE